MFVEEEKEEIGYEPHDGCYGIVECSSKKGAYLTLDNGELAFAYRFCNLRPGTKVLCTVRKMPEGDRRKLVTIDAVRYYPTAA